jgi:hypothetical protein
MGSLPAAKRKTPHWKISKRRCRGAIVDYGNLAARDMSVESPTKVDRLTYGQRLVADNDTTGQFKDTQIASDLKNVALSTLAEREYSKLEHVGRFIHLFIAHSWTHR